MRYTVILANHGPRGFSVSVPAMPGCYTVGRSVDEALANAREAAGLWLDSVTADGGAAPENSPAVAGAGVTEQLEILAELRAAGDIEPAAPILLELAEVEIPLPSPV